MADVRGEAIYGGLDQLLNESENALLEAGVEFEPQVRHAKP